MTDDMRELISLVKIAWKARLEYPQVSQAALQAFHRLFNEPPAAPLVDDQPPLPLEQSKPVSKRKPPPVGTPRWSPQELAVVAPWEGKDAAIIPYGELGAQLVNIGPGRSRKAIEKKIRPAKPNSAPPSTNAQTEDGQGHSEPEIVDEPVTEHRIDSAEATSEPAETGKRDELKARYAASRTTPPPALPSPQSRIDSEMSRALRNSKGGGLSTLDTQPDYEAALSTGDPLLERLNDDKFMGSR